MPNYTFEDTNTGDVYEMTMRISERDEFVKDNPHMRQLITGAPSIVGGVSGMGRMKNDGGWQENMSRIAEAHPGSPFADRYGKASTKEIKTREVLKKHKVIK
jgi:hypothetical protein